MCTSSSHWRLVGACLFGPLWLLKGLEQRGNILGHHTPPSNSVALLLQSTAQYFKQWSPSPLPLWPHNRGWRCPIRSIHPAKLWPIQLSLIRVLNVYAMTQKPFQVAVLQLSICQTSQKFNFLPFCTKPRNVCLLNVCNIFFQSWLISV